MPKFTKKDFKKKLLTKYRLVLMDDSTFEKRLSLKITRLNVFIIGSLLSLFLIFVTVFVIAFTPLKQYIPGYGSLEERNKLYNLSLKADSIENILKIGTAYMDTLLMILSGDENIQRVHFSEDFVSLDNEIKNADLHAGKTAVKHQVSHYFHQTLFFYKPVEGIVTQKFSPAINHFGIDIVSKKNAPVVAIRDGTVIIAQWTHHYGNIIIIKHQNDIISIYKHNSALLKSEGDNVKGGEVIAISGNTGELTTGPHLHFELWMNGVPVNPAIFFNY